MIGTAALVAALAAVAYAPIQVPAELASFATEGAVTVVVKVALGLVVLSLPMLHKLWRQKEVPGPWPLPLVGNALAVAATPDVPKLYEKWEKRYAGGKGLFKYFFLNYPIVVVSDVNIARMMMLRKFSIFKNHTPLPPSFVPLLPGEMKVMQYGMDISRDVRWKGLRSTANSIFHNVHTMSGFCPLMKEIADELADRLGEVKEGESIDIWRAFGDMTLDVLGSTVFGVRFNSVRSDGSDAVEAARTLFRINIASPEWNPYLAAGLVLPRFMGPLLGWMMDKFPTQKMKKVVWAIGVLAKMSTELYEGAMSELEGGATKASDHENLLKLFIEAHNRETGNLLSRDEVKAQALLYLLAGYETTANTLAYCVYLLSKNKDKEQALIHEIDALESPVPTLDEIKSLTYVEGVVKESLRLYGPIPFTDRQASETTDLTDHLRIFKEQCVHISTRSMSLNLEYFPDPDKFLPERFVKGSDLYDRQNHHAFMPWGAGPRMCVASDFALTEAKLALVTLYRKYRFVLDPVYKLELHFAVSLAPKNGVHVFVRKR